MATSYTSLLGLALPVQGELVGSWGDTVNNAITSLLDTAVAGTTTLSTDADVTLTDTTGASNQSRQLVLLWTAGGSATRNITAPARSKAYVVINATGGTQSIVVRGAGPTTGVTVVAGERCLVAWNGSDFVKVASTISTLTSVSGTLGVANGGTGATTLTGLVVGNGTSAFTTVTAPSGAVVGTTDAQTLSGKTLTDPAITGTILEDVYTETTASSTLTIDPGNGSIQVITLGQSATSVSLTNFAAGEAVTVMIADGTAYTITWSTSVTWVGGTAPTLATSGYTVVELWKVSSTVYGARVGDVA